MTRKDYVAIAQALAYHRPPLYTPEQEAACDWSLSPAYLVWSDIRLELSGLLAGDNPRFDSKRFYEATER